MIKHIVHIDRNYPRKFNGIDTSDQSDVTSDLGWKFDTQAESTLNGDIAKESENYKIKLQSENDSNPDQLFDDKTATNLQYDNLVEKQQIRFDANAFNYIVHTSIENVILKYDAPVFCGNEDWQENIIVLDSADYPIFINILINDPMGVDKYAYRAYVKNEQFAYCDRPNGVLNSNNDTNYKLGNGKIKLGTEDLKGFEIEEIEKEYDKGYTEKYSYRIKILLSGNGYTADDINSTSAQLTAWEEILEKEDATEEEITKAWENCQGVKFKFFDVAGNTTYWVMPHININIISLADLYNIKKLTLEFINTTPENLQLGTDLIGRTTIKVTNPNSILADYPIHIRLDEKSIGQLQENSFKQYYITTKSNNATHNVASIATQNVDNIDESGWITAHAYIDIDNLITNATKAARAMIQNLSYVTNSLGEWIKECSDNIRKINLDPFVSQYLKETTNKNNAYYKFVKFTENYLNTMYKAYDKNCYISVLEVIHRINNFNDPTLIYGNLLTKFDDDHGDMLHINFDEMRTIIDTNRTEQEED